MCETFFNRDIKAAAAVTAVFNMIETILTMKDNQNTMQDQPPFRNSSCVIYTQLKLEKNTFTIYWFLQNVQTSHNVSHPILTKHITGFRYD